MPATIHLTMIGCDWAGRRHAEAPMALAAPGNNDRAAPRWAVDSDRRRADGAVGVLVESFLMKSLVTASGPEVHTLRIDGDLGSLTTAGDGMVQIFSERGAYLPGGSPAVVMPGRR